MQVSKRLVPFPCENQGFVHRLQEVALENIGVYNSAPHMWVKKAFHLSSCLNCKLTGWCTNPIYPGAYQAWLWSTSCGWVAPFDFLCWFFGGFKPQLLWAKDDSVFHRYFQLNASVFLRKFLFQSFGLERAWWEYLWVNYNVFTWKRWVQKSPFFRFPWWDICFISILYIVISPEVACQRPPGVLHV